MPQKESLTRLVRPLPRGQITLPTEKKAMRDYSGEEIRRFLRQDRLDPKTAKKARRLLRSFNASVSGVRDL